MILRAQIEEVGIGLDLLVFARMLRRRRPDHGEAIGIWKRQRAQENGVDHAEDGAVGSDPEGEGDDRDEGKAGRFDELPKGVAEIIHKVAQASSLHGCLVGSLG